MLLEGWIEPQRLSPDSLQADARQLASDSFHSIMLDRFFLPDRLESLRHLFAKGGWFDAAVL